MHLQIDTTWIVQNCKAIALGASTSAEALNSTPPSACPYSPTEAGFLFGLGLNGHLNKLSPHHIREFTIQVHDLNNAAVILGMPKSPLQLALSALIIPRLLFCNKAT